MGLIHFINDADSEAGGAQKILHSLVENLASSEVYGFDFIYKNGLKKRSNIIICFFYFLIYFLLRPDYKVIIHHRAFLPFTLLMPKRKSYFICHNIFPSKNFIFKIKANIKYIAVSDEVKRYILSINNSADVVVINNGIDINEKYCRVSKLNNKKFNISFVGRISYQKGIDLLFEAFLDFHMKYNQTLLNVIGPLGDIDIAKYQNNESIIFHGYHKEPFLLCKSTDLLVVPSRYEGFGLVYYEALGYKHSVLASNLDIFQKNDADVYLSFFEQCNKSDLTKKLESIYLNFINDPESYRSMDNLLDVRHPYKNTFEMTKSYGEVFNEEKF
ncbi:glycosyltransferase family 4 protein [Pseudoalteromonas ulvae]|uniref:Glycosyl transferase family 1 domain-containing protein n=1 Tax=Pseudoalteromonas ulvae TaxID=107327 RepID=A0A244CTD0_PSEDV|nr:glycosyltransferase family 4 protein [Pseudoalteromonas ulvae]OUL58867.1 hypothetical protein B1199_00860 [Pseudoalteromonas ulvae]